MSHSPDQSRTPMIAKIVSHAMNMQKMRPSVQPALNRLVTTSWRDVFEKKKRGEKLVLG